LKDTKDRGRPLISIKKYLDGQQSVLTHEAPEAGELLTATMDSYRSALRAIGKSAVQACAAPGRELERGLADLESELSLNIAPRLVQQTQEQVDECLHRWGCLTAEHLKSKADDVRELLMVLARTAESVGERDQRYATQFVGLTVELRAIATLDDLTQIRSSLVSKANQMKDCVDQMAIDGQQSLAQMRSRISSYESRLEAVELLASRDTVTGLANRRSIETRMQWKTDRSETYCVVILDLNGFKQVNDRYGHAAGDVLLRSFAQELQNNLRSDDLVGRWGGDEFIVILNRDLAGATAQIERIREWVFGNYPIQAGKGKEPVKVAVTGSVGLAEWAPGRTIDQVIEQADAAMYLDKKESRRKKA
jgi:diguanylate cyclase (GGDEF)-like protein